MAGADGEFVVAGVLVDVGGGQGEAQGAVVIAPGQDARSVRAVTVGQFGPGRADRGGGGEGLALVQRTQGADIDGGADRGAVDVGLGRFVDIGAGDDFGRQDVEGELAAVVVRGQGAAVDGDGVELGAEAAHGHETAFAAVAVNGDARHALKRFRHVLIGQLAQVLGRDRVDDADGFTLDVDGLLLAGADAGDDDLVYDGGVLVTGIRSRCDLSRGDGG
ncbi:hypothetical protein D3C73_552850 [compost metagenome]